MKIIRLQKIAAVQEYMIEKGILYDENGDDVFSINELLTYNVPIMKSAQQANEFLAQLEKATGKQFGRVPEENLLKSLRYKDTKKERQEERLKFEDERTRDILEKGKLR